MGTGARISALKPAELSRYIPYSKQNIAFIPIFPPNATLALNM